jgi:uncharacterized membrane protein YjjP (DUF1212 family)
VTDPAAKPARGAALTGRLRARRQRARERLEQIAARAIHDVTIAEPVPDQAPEAILDFLRQLGVAMCQAQDNAERITQILDDVAKSYGARGVSFFVLPTGVFVRIDTGGATRVDFAPGGSAPLRLDQIDALYRLIDDIRHGRLGVAAASVRLDKVLHAPPRFGAVATVAGSAVLTTGLGLMLNPTAAAIPAYVVLGVVTGVLEWWAKRDHTLAPVLPVAMAFAVTWLSFEVMGPLFDVPALDLVIPALVTQLPGAALTMATVELAAGSMLSGSARLVYGLQRLLLLTFGIGLGVEVAGLPGDVPDSAALGAWAPWLGVLVFGFGHLLGSSVPRATLRWLLLVLYVAYATQVVAGLALGALGASFVAGAVVLPVAYAVQERRSGPPVPVTFLPAFWLLVPGALGLEGVAEIVGADAAAGLGDFLNALLTVVAIAVGVLVGAGISERFGRATARWRGI